MLAQRRRRFADVVPMLYKCFVFAGKGRGCFEIYLTVCFSTGFDVYLVQIQLVESWPLNAVCVAFHQ